jgi:uncharacterized protein YbjQ (UPF0145 family)
LSFFSRRGDDDPRRAESLERIESGGIPLAAEERLRSLGSGGSIFTSGLSVKEFSLLTRMGSRPLAQVMGASVVRSGWQYLPALEPGVVVNTGSPNTSTAIGAGWQSRFTEASPSQVRSYRWHANVVCELDVIAHAWATARRRALDRLSEEALQVGADAVVGVHLTRDDHDLGERTIEYAVTGTAVRLADRTATAWPVLTGLSVQDYWRLNEAGYEPAGFVSATTVVFASASRSLRMRRLRSAARNGELDELSRAFRKARETVRMRMEGQVRDARGAGAVGVELSHSVRRDKLAVASSLQPSTARGWYVGRLGLPYLISGRADVERSGWMITMHGAGTAIRGQPGRSRYPIKTTVRLSAK